MGVIGIIYLIFLVLAVVGMWKSFTKAGQPGWAGFIPIYFNYVLTMIAGLEILWFVLSLIPIINIYAWYKISQGIAKNFGKSSNFAWGLFFLAPIFLMILGFGSAKYTGTAAAAAPPVQQ